MGKVNVFRVYTPIQNTLRAESLSIFLDISREEESRESPLLFPTYLGRLKETARRVRFTV